MDLASKAPTAEECIVPTIALLLRFFVMFRLLLADLLGTATRLLCLRSRAPVAVANTSIFRIFGVEAGARSLTFKL